MRLKLAIAFQIYLIQVLILKGVILTAGQVQDQDVTFPIFMPTVRGPMDGEWDPEGPSEINLTSEDCNQGPDHIKFAELRYLNMTPPCEDTMKKGYCGIRRNQNITLVAKFVPKTFSEQFKFRVNLVDVNFGFETALWPEFSACTQFNITCPQEAGELLHGYVNRELPKDIPPVSAIVRIRLVMVSEKGEKNVAICRQVKFDIL